MTEAEQSNTRLSLGKPTQPRKERVYQYSMEAARSIVSGGLGVAPEARARTSTNRKWNRRHPENN
jgi:hypothetical protein